MVMSGSRSTTCHPPPLGPALQKIVQLEIEKEKLRAVEVPKHRQHECVLKLCYQQRPQCGLNQNLSGTRNRRRRVACYTLLEMLWLDSLVHWSRCVSKVAVELA